MAQLTRSLLTSRQLPMEQWLGTWSKNTLGHYFCVLWRLLASYASVFFDSFASSHFQFYRKEGHCVVSGFDLAFDVFWRRLGNDRCSRSSCRSCDAGTDPDGWPSSLSSWSKPSLSSYRGRLWLTVASQRARFLSHPLSSYWKDKGLRLLICFFSISLTKPVNQRLSSNPLWKGSRQRLFKKNVLKHLKNVLFCVFVGCPLQSWSWSDLCDWLCPIFQFGGRP